MTTVSSTEQFNFYDLDFNKIVAGAEEFFFNNNEFRYWYDPHPAFEPTVYEDTAFVIWVEGTRWSQSVLAGQGMQYSGQSATGGILEAYLEEWFGNTAIGQAPDYGKIWWFQGTSIPVVEFQAAANSASTVDDRLLFSRELSGSDVFHLSPFADTALGLGGDDTLFGNGGNDTLHGGEGNDSLVGGNGNDFLRPDAGDDTVEGGVGNDEVFAGPGDMGDDIIRGGAGNDTMGGAQGDDQIFGGTGSDLSFGGAGNDLIDESGTDTSSNTAWAGAGLDTVIGGDGDDVLGGGAGADVVSGGAGNDVIYPGAGPDNDTLNGEAGNDTIFGGGGDDVIDGGADDDQLFNGGGNDTVSGGSGSDEIWGGGGNDLLMGDADADTFAFAEGNGDDTVSDFNFAELDLLNVLGLGLSTREEALGAMTDTENGVLLSADGTTILFEGQEVADFISSEGWFDDTML